MTKMFQGSAEHGERSVRSSDGYDDDWVQPPATLPLSMTAGLGPDNEVCFHEIRNASGVIIASTWGGPDADLAALIVKAVNCHADLVKALDLAHEALKRLRFNRDQEPAFAKAADAIRAALQKAQAAA